MPFVIEHGDLNSYGQALAVLARINAGQKNEDRAFDQQQTAQRTNIAQQSVDLQGKRFEYDRENDVAQRQHATDIVELQNRLYLERDREQLESLPQKLRAQADAAAAAEEQQWSMQQKRELQTLDTAELNLKTSPDFDDQERADGIEAIARKRMSILSAGAISAKNPWPKGQRPGDIFEYPAGSGVFVTRKHDGDISLIHRADQADFKAKEFFDVYKDAAASLTGLDGAAPSPDAVEALATQRIAAYQRYKAAQQLANQPIQPPTPAAPARQVMADVRMRDAALSQNRDDAKAVLGPSALRPEDTGRKDAGPKDSSTIGANVTAKGKAQYSKFIPPDHPIYTVPEGTQFSAQNLNGKPGTITAAELFAAALRYEMPIDDLAKLLGIQAPGDDAHAQSEPAEARPVSMIGGYE